MLEVVKPNLTKHVWFAYCRGAADKRKEKGRDIWWRWGELGWAARFSNDAHHQPPASSSADDRSTQICAILYSTRYFAK